MIPTVIADVSHKCSVNENDIVWVPDAWVWNDDTTIECIVNPDFPILPDAQFQLRKCFHSKKTLEVFYCYGKAKMRARVANLIERHLQNALNEQKDNFLAAIKQQDEKIDEITKTSNSHNIRANTNFTNLQNEQSAHKETLWFYRHLCAGTFFVCLAGFIAYIYLKTLKTQRVFR
jgi:hypothetical protein